MVGAILSVERKFVRSMIGKESEILSANGLLPKGFPLVIGTFLPKRELLRNVGTPIIRNDSLVKDPVGAHISAADIRSYAPSLSGMPWFLENVAIS